MKGSCILLTVDPKGRRIEGIAGTTTIKPGMAIMIAPGIPLQNGRPTYVPYGYVTSPTTGNAAAAGDPRLKCIATEDFEQGFNYATAYALGTRLFGYCPLPGDELNLLFAGETGTSSFDAYVIGERVIPLVPGSTDPGASAGGPTGKFGSGGSPSTGGVSSSTGAWAMVMEHVDEVTDVDTLIFCEIQ